MNTLLDIIHSGKRLLFDGAMGTMLQRRGLPPGESPEVFCLSHPDILEGIHFDYIEAGADIITTNTFGGTSYKLPDGIQVREFNKLMARAAKKAAMRGQKKVFVAGSVGPTGLFLAPLGETPFEEMVFAFEEQIQGLVEGGIDCIIAETQFDIAEARAIVIAAKRVCSLPIIVSMTYEEGRTLTGSSVAVCVATLANMGVVAIGMNCSAGPKEMQQAATELLAECPVPVIIQPNAGLPVLQDGETLFPLEPEPFAELTSAFGAQGVQILGGCCGTSPHHIASLAKRIAQLPPVAPRPVFSGVTLTSRSTLVRIGQGHPVCVIGERINPTGKKLLSAQFQAGELGEALRFADEQLKAGATILDVNTGAPMVDETILLPELVAQLQTDFSAPLALDSPNSEALAKALPIYAASPLINSISGEEGRIDQLGPLCRDYGAPFILLPLQGGNVPEKAKERIAIIEEMLSKLDAMGVPRSLAIVDVLALSISSTPSAVQECLEVIAYCTNILHLPTTCGLSNISFGLPARELLNTSFFVMGVGQGLSSCIANPSSRRLQEALDASNLFSGYDLGAEQFTGHYGNWSDSSGTGGRGNSDGGKGGGSAKGAADIQTVGEAVIAGRRDLIIGLVQAELDAGVPPFDIVGKKLIPAITEVGVKYERKEYFLPQLIRSAETMQTAFGLLEPLLVQESHLQKKPVIIMATVEGDIHDIGKNIVALMLGNHGFDVKDIGKNIPAQRIVEAAVEHKASLIGLSALMTTTMVKMEETVLLLKKNDIACPVMVGGAVVTEAFARSIGAHYAKDAVEAVRTAQQLLG